MANSSQIRIGENIIKSSEPQMRFLKSILDKLEVPYVLDNVSFHNTLQDLYHIKTAHGTDVWKVEKDGSVSLKNRFGHNGRFGYHYLRMPSLIEFQFVDLDILTEEETEFLGYIIYEAEATAMLSLRTG